MPFPCCPCPAASALLFVFTEPRCAAMRFVRHITRPTLHGLLLLQPGSAKKGGSGTAGFPPRRSMLRKTRSRQEQWLFFSFFLFGLCCSVTSSLTRRCQRRRRRAVSLPPLPEAATEGRPHKTGTPASEVLPCFLECRRCSSSSVRC